MGRRLLSLLVVSAACGSKRGTPLHPAGSAFDDGAGQLAAASGALFFDGADQAGGLAAERRADQAFADQVPEYGGSSYGGSIYGGASYGGASYGGAVPPSAPAHPPPPYYNITVPTGGAVTGTVRWPRPPRAPATLTSACGEIANPSLVLGANGAVADTIVYVDKIVRGRALSAAARTLQIGGQVERRGCALVPAVQIVSPAPSSLEVINADDTAIKLTAGADAIALAPGMSRRTPLDAGIVKIADAGGATAPAWAIALVHPYVALTDGDGKFRIDDIPAGTYELVIWHAPVVTGMKDGQVIVGAPIVVRRALTIADDRATALTIDLPAAP